MSREERINEINKFMGVNELHASIQFVWTIGESLSSGRPINTEGDATTEAEFEARNNGEDLYAVIKSYDNSWDRIIPVIEMISVTKLDNPDDQNTIDHHFEKITEDLTSDFDLHDVFERVSDFCKWYNNLNQ